MSEQPAWADTPMAGSVRDAVATNLRRARLARGYSLRDLAELTGVSKALLSQIERSVANPTVDVLVRVGTAVDLTFNELTRELVLAPEVIRAKEGASILSDDVTIRMLFGSSDRRRFELSEGIVPPGVSTSKSSHGAGSIEHTYILDGHLTLSSQDWSYDLGPGDAIRFSSEFEHAYRTGREGARLLTLISFSDT